MTTEGCAVLRPPVNAIGEPYTPRRWMPRQRREAKEVPGTVGKRLNELAWGKAPWPLCLWGDVGAGKTCAALWMTDTYGGLYYTLATWCLRLTDAMNGRLQTEAGYPVSVAECWSDWGRAPLTVLDELGGRNPSDFTRETLQQCIDCRHGLPSVFISNLNLDALSGVYDARIASRLSAGTQIRMRGDRRIKNGAT